MRDTTIVRLWPIPRLFQIGFILVVLGTLLMAATPQFEQLFAPADTSSQCTPEGLCSGIETGMNRAMAIEGPLVDYDVLVGAVGVPLVIGIVAAVATRGRGMLGRVWYGTVWMGLALMIWTVAHLLLASQPLLYMGVMATVANALGGVTPATAIVAVVMLLLVSFDAWWQRRKYSAMRAWSLVGGEAMFVMLTAALLFQNGHAFDEAATTALWLIGLAVSMMGIVFLVFWRRDILLRAKFVGLVVIMTVLASYICGKASPSLLAALLSVVAVYALSLALIGLKPRQLVR